MTNKAYLKGGSWYNDPKVCRSAVRNKDDLDFRVSNYGFRLLFVRIGNESTKT